MRKTHFTHSLILAGLLALPGSLLAAEPQAQAGKPVAMVNGVAIPDAYADLVKQERVARGQPPQTINDEEIRNSLVSAEILAQEAVKKGLDKDAKVQATIELNRKELLGRALLEEYARSHPPSDAALKAEYERLKTAAGTVEYHPRQIVVATEAEAKDIIAKLNGKKAKFEDLAKKQSRHLSKVNGGDLGWVVPMNAPPEFSAVMTKLKKGEYTKAPVNIGGAWHVIRLDDTRPFKLPAFDQLKPRITAHLQQQALQKYAEELRAAAKVE